MNSMWHQSQHSCESNRQTLNKSNEFNLTSILTQLQRIQSNINFDTIATDSI
jgi:hypothetical protein